MEKKDIKISKNILKSLYYSLAISISVFYFIEHDGKFEYNRVYQTTFFTTAFNNSLNTQFYVENIYGHSGSIGFYDYIDRAVIYFYSIFIDIIPFLVLLIVVFLIVHFFRRFRFKIV